MTALVLAALALLALPPAYRRVRAEGAARRGRILVALSRGPSRRAELVHVPRRLRALRAAEAFALRAHLGLLADAGLVRRRAGDLYELTPLGREVRDGRRPAGVWP